MAGPVLSYPCHMASSAVLPRYQVRGLSPECKAVKGWDLLSELTPLELAHPRPTTRASSPMVPWLGAGPALPLSSPQGQLSLPHCPGEGQDQYSRVTSAREGRGQLCNSAALRSLDVAPSCSPDQGLPRGLWWSHGPQTSTQTAVAARPGPRHGPGWQHRLFLATPSSPVLPLFIAHKPFHLSFSTTPCTCSL